jgi:hypothetical protein
LIGPEHLIKYVAAAHTRICFSSVSPLQEATAVAFEQAEGRGFWEESKTEMKGKLDRFNQIWDELGLPVSCDTSMKGSHASANIHLTVLRARRRLLRPRQLGQSRASRGLPFRASRRQQASRLQALVVLHQGTRRSSHSADRVLH